MSPTSAGRDSNPGRSGTFGGEITVCSLSRATTSRPRPPASRLTNLPTVPPILMQIVNRFLENSFKIWMFFSPNSILEKCPLVKQYILILNLYFLTYKSTAPIVKCKLLVFTWNRRMSRGLPAFFRQFWLHFRKNFKKNL